jgi:DNA-binding NtrC family response regulator
MPSRKRILFVDDEPSIRLTLATILEGHGFDVRTAATVAEALEEINSRPFDALLSDLNVGEKGNGFTIVSAMRRTQPHCVNIILTGYPAFETAVQAIRQQVDDYLVKPADVETLVARLRETFESRNEAESSTRKRA